MSEPLLGKLFIGIRNTTTEDRDSSDQLDGFSAVYIMYYKVQLVVDCVGLVGNCLGVLIMLRKNMRGSPFAVCALCLAMSDSCYLVSSAVYRTG